VCTEGLNPGIISSGNDGGLPAVLTLQSTGQNLLHVHGHIDLRAKTVNNALVGVNNVLGASVEHAMKLSTWPKSGSGEWYANDGRLEVLVSVSGSAKWRISGDSSEALIWINAECTDLSGNVELTQGTLDVDQNFCTSGNLTFDGRSTGTRIAVASLRSAQFGGTCP